MPYKPNVNRRPKEAAFAEAWQPSANASPDLNHYPANCLSTYGRIPPFR